MNVKFLNTLYFPSESERRANELLQQNIFYYNAELSYLSREMNEYQTFIFKERSHNALRQKMKLICNNKEKDLA